MITGQPTTSCSKFETVRKRREGGMGGSGKRWCKVQTADRGEREKRDGILFELACGGGRCAGHFWYAISYGTLPALENSIRGTGEWMGNKHYNQRGKVRNGSRQRKPAMRKKQHRRGDPMHHRPLHFLHKTCGKG
jgi:hypothetical protein